MSNNPANGKEIFERMSRNVAELPPIRNRLISKEKEIREALAAATPGPWKLGNVHWHKGCYGKTCKQSIVSPGIGGSVAVAFGAQYRAKGEWSDPRTEINSPNAVLIAHTPEWLQYLLTEVESLRSQLAHMTGTRQIIAEDHADIVEERDELLRANTTMREALQWYADDKNWKLGVSITMGSAFPLHEAIKSDKGEHARAALASISLPDDPKEAGIDGKEPV